ncbi:hypothetical protein RIEGSTA812A_PEG_216 [invertebrate metagenome]|uniref:Uncharacterized protein n=1 Tax=invertebrate metagenome TaxID=1711999 RepID=A0A484H7T2_9ZZZZ
MRTFVTHMLLAWRRAQAHERMTSAAEVAMVVWMDSSGLLIL